MNKKTLIILALVTVVIIAVVWFNDRNADLTDGRSANQSATSGLILPKLVDQLDQVGQVVIAKAGSDPAVTLKLKDDNWTVAEKGGYAADVGKLRQQLRALAAATIIEPMTSKPDYYSRLGVQALTAADSKATAVRINSLAGEPLGKLLIGEAATRGNAKVGYARVEDADQAMLIDADFSIATEATDWLVKDILKVQPNELWRIKIEHADGEVLSAKRSAPDTDFVVDQPLPEGRDFKYIAIANSLTQPLQNLRLDDVAKFDEAKQEGYEITTSTYARKDGLVITVQTWKQKEDRRVHLTVAWDANAVMPKPAADGEEAEADHSAAQQEADKLNDQLSPWAFEIAAYSWGVFQRRMEDLLKTEGAAASEAQ